MVKVYGTCKMCGKVSYVELTQEENEGYENYIKGTTIQNALPDTSPSVREFLMPGHYCNKCQKMLFGKSDERIITI